MGVSEKIYSRESFILHKPRISRIIATFSLNSRRKFLKNLLRKLPIFLTFFVVRFLKIFPSAVNKKIFFEKY